MDAQERPLVWKLRPAYIWYAIRVKVSKVLLTIGLFINSPLAVACAFVLPVTRLRSNKWNRQSRILVYYKMGGVDDLEELFKTEQPNFEVVFLRRDFQKRVAKHFFPSRALSDFTFKKYASSERRAAYAVFMTGCFKYIDRLLPFNLVLQFHITYYQERDIASALAPLGKKFVTLQKEGLRPRASWQKMVRVYQIQLDKYVGSKILTYNQATKDCLTVSGIVEKDKVHVIGMPRLDHSHHLRIKRTHPVVPTITFFLIDPIAGLPNIVNDDGTIGPMRFECPNGDLIVWDKLVNNVNQAMITYANDNPSIRVKLKGKGLFSNYSDQFASNLPANVEVCYGPTGHHLLENSSVVVAYNSTIIFEAIAASLPVIIPHLFGGDEPHPMLKYNYRLNDVAKIVNTYDELCESLSGALNLEQKSAPDNDWKRRAVLTEHLGNPDGKSSERLHESLQTLFRS